MEITFAIIAVLTLASALAAMSLRNLVHCALCLALAFGGLAMVYLSLDAQFVGFAQILVYIGAVAILIVFAILLTRSSEPTPQPILSSSWVVGIGVALLVLGALGAAITRSRLAHRVLPAEPEITVKQIGDKLMTQYVLPLEVVALLLTAALIGAVIIAMQERKTK